MGEGREVVLMTRLRRQYNREYREYNSKKEKSYIWDVASYDHRLTTRPHIFSLGIAIAWFRSD